MNWVCKLKNVHIVSLNVGRTTLVDELSLQVKQIHIVPLNVGTTLVVEYRCFVSYKLGKSTLEKMFIVKFFLQS